MRVDRKHIQISGIKSGTITRDTPVTKSEAFSLVWELSSEIYSLSGKYDVESRLQRHIVSVIKVRG